MCFQKVATGAPVALTGFIMAFLQTTLAVVLIVFPILHCLAVRNDDTTVR